MSNSGDIEYDELREILQWHVESGTDGLCILGTTGEATTLSMKERECKKFHELQNNSIEVTTPTYHSFKYFLHFHAITKLNISHLENSC